MHGRASSASHPVGTTVRIQNFLHSIPVRRQTATKSASKTLGSIKKLLQSYAFARPTVRLSFKVLKAKTPKDDWRFAPGSAEDGVETVAKVLGRPVTLQLISVAASSGVDDDAAGPTQSVSMNALVQSIDTGQCSLRFSICFSHLNSGQYSKPFWPFHQSRWTPANYASWSHAGHHQTL